MDGLGVALFYLMIANLIKLIFRISPFVIGFIFLMIWVYKTHRRLFKGIMTVAVIIAVLAVISIIAYNTVLKPLVHTPAYMAEHSKKYDPEDFEESWSNQDRICKYLHQEKDRIDREADWIKSYEDEKRYVTELFRYRMDELPDVKDIDYLQAKDIDRFYDTAEWNIEHYFNHDNNDCRNPYSWGDAIWMAPDIDYDKYDAAILITYNDRTMDVADNGPLY